MTASVDTLGEIHTSLAEVCKQLLAVREEPIIVGGEPVYDKAGELLMRKVYPTAAEVTAVTTFLKNNSITAVAGNENKLAQLREEMEKRRAGKRVPRVTQEWTPPDAHAVIPNPDTPWQ